MFEFLKNLFVPARFNQAQKLMMAMGVPHDRLTLGHKLGRQPSHTKKGPGRKHLQGPSAGGE